MTLTSSHRWNTLGVGVLVCLLAGPLTAWAQRNSSPREKYHSALEMLQSRAKSTVEPVFLLGLAAARQLQEALGREDMAPSLVPELTPEDMKLQGFVVSTEEVLYAVPDPAFFLKLARKKGKPVDVAFFENLQRTFAHHPAWPVFIEQQTDFSGCTRYNAPELITVYRGWTEFAAKHPKAYAEVVTREINRIHEAMTRDGCACEQAEGVTAGFEAFLRAFPKAPIADKVKTRLEALREGKGDFRFECKSG